MGYGSRSGCHYIFRHINSDAAPSKGRTIPDTTILYLMVSPS